MTWSFSNTKQKIQGKNPTTNLSQIYDQEVGSFSWLDMLSRKHEEESFLSAWIVNGHFVVKRICFVICKLSFPLHCLWLFLYVSWLKLLIPVPQGMLLVIIWMWGGWDHGCPSLSLQQTWQKGIFGKGAGWAAVGGMSSSAALRLGSLPAEALSWESDVLLGQFTSQNHKSCVKSQYAVKHINA